MQKTKAFLVLWVTCALLIAHGRETAVVAQGGPAPGWFDADIGSVGQAGSASQSDDTFTVRGGGSDIWGTSDSFNFAYTPLAGDGDIWVLARSQTATNPFAKAGVMIRQSLDPSSPFAIFDVKPDGGLELMIRTTQGGTTTFVKGAPTSGPTFLRLSRRGAQVAAFIQTPGPTCSMGCDQWTMFSDNWIGLQDGPMLMGLAVTSHDPSTVNSAVLDFWGTQKLNAPWRQADFYPETHVDSAFTLTQPGQSDTYVLPAAGADIWGTADSFKYVWQRVDGDTTIVARVTGERYTNSFAKAGVMMRNNLTPGAQSIVLDVKPDGGIEFMARAQEDTGATQFLAGGFMPFPAWLKLERHGSLFIGSQSSDGQTWTVVGSTSIPMRTEMFAGLAATSHTSTYTPFGATFDNVSLSQPHGADLLKKGGFEEYTTSSLGAPGWVSDTVRQVPAIAEGAAPHTGARNGACRTTESLDCGIFQDVTLSITADFVFNVWASSDKPGGLVGVDINGALQASQPVSVGGYQSYSIGFFGIAGQTVRVWMYSPNRPGAIVIDDASLVNVGNGPR